MRFHAKAPPEAGHPLVSVIKILGGFRLCIDKAAGRGYHNFNSLKQTNAMTRSVAPRRKHREKAVGVSLRERGAVNVTCEQPG